MVHNVTRIIFSLDEFNHQSGNAAMNMRSSQNLPSYDKTWKVPAKWLAFSSQKENAAHLVCMASSVSHSGNPTLLGSLEKGKQRENVKKPKKGRKRSGEYNI